MFAIPNLYYRAAAATALFTISGLASAQDSVYEQEFAFWPAAGYEVPGEFESVTAGDVNGDGREDLVVNCLQGVVVMFSVATTTAPHALFDGPFVPHMANEVAVHPDTGEIFSVGYYGLTSWVWNATTGSFDDTLVTASWAGGTDLRFVEDLHGDGSNSLIALDSGGSNILIHKEYQPGSWSAQPSIATIGSAVDLTEVQWSGSSSTNPLEICYANAAGIRVVDLAGTSQYSRGTTLNSRIARARSAGSADRIEWLAGPTGNGKSYLSSVGPTGILGTIELAGTDAANLATGDINGDGIDDCIVTFTNSATTFDVSVHRFALNASTMDAQALTTCQVDWNVNETYTADVTIPDSGQSQSSTEHDHFFILIEPMNGTTVAGRTLIYEYSWTGENTITLDHASTGWLSVIGFDPSSICGPGLGPIGTTGGGLSKKRTPPVPPNVPPAKGPCPPTPPA